FDTISDMVLELFHSKWGWLLPGGALIKGILLVKDKWDEIWTGIQEKVQVVWDKITSIIESAVEKLKAPVELITGGLDKAKGIVGGVTDLGSGLFSGISVPGFAGGGVALRSGLALVGERGP
ncbi:MAG: hypothetical protein ACE5Q6_24120, partial [Dehalococcoidia bacterium]